MADVVNRTTVEYLRSVNTPDYPTANWIINPDLSALTGVPEKYWKVVGDTVVEMTQGEKDTVDATAAANVLLTQSLEEQTGIFETTSSEYVSVLELTPTNAFDSGSYNIHWSAAVKRQSNRGLIKLRLLIDAVETYTLADIDPKQWVIQTGPTIIKTWAQDTHTVTLQVAATVEGRSVLVKNARLAAERTTNG